MLYALVLILAVALTYLITDFRRWLEIQEIETAHAEEIELTFDSAYDAGYAAGEMLGRIESNIFHMRNQ